jgi:hypothetical protein
MIGVIVSEKNRVDTTHARRNQLQPELWRRVYEYVGPAIGLDQRTDARAFVPGIS